MLITNTRNDTMNHAKQPVKAQESMHPALSAKKHVTSAKLREGSNGYQARSTIRFSLAADIAAFDGTQITIHLLLTVLKGSLYKKNWERLT